MKRGLGLLVASALWIGMLGACRKAERAATAAALAPGDGVWFSSGIAAGEQVQGQLAEAGLVRLFLPAARVVRDGEGWKIEAGRPPGPPVPTVPIHLMIRAEGLEGSWKAEGETGLERLAEAVAAAAREAADSGAWGSVAGAHFEGRLTTEAAEEARFLAERIRPRLPEKWSLSFTISSLPADGGAAEALAAIPVDAFLAVVFGSEPLDPVRVEALGKPWWAVYEPSASGTWSPASGSRETLDEAVFSELTDHPRVEIGHDISLAEMAYSGFVFRFRAPVTVAGRRFAPGDRVLFRQPAFSDLLYRLGADAANKKQMLGRVLRLSGGRDAGRVVSLEALVDVVLGRPLDPELGVQIDADERSVTLGAANASPHASLVSRTGNWIEIEIPTGGIRDVDLGGFDRFEVADAEGRAVTLARATRVKFFETLVSPHETIAAAKVSLRTPPPVGCCSQRSQVLSSSGRELALDWRLPTPVPSPSPVPRPARR